MHNTNIPPKSQLPSKKKLIRSTILAAFTAGVLLITIVMPAEYGVDPTGFGQASGLKAMGEIKRSLAQEASAEQMAAEAGAVTAPTAEGQASVSLDAIVPASADKPADTYRDTMTVTLAPNEGAEIKVDMAKGETTSYVWWTDGGKANFDVHADSKALAIDYHNYSKGSEQRKEGEITAAFDGSHGWFWRNRTRETLTVTLQTDGDYSAIKRVK
jgi:hypothetical protein